MKLQVGMVFDDDSHQATTRDLSEMLRCYGGRSFSTSGNLVDGPAAFGFRGDIVRKREAGEILPLADSLYVLTWDGRLDNRDDILGRLNLAQSRAWPDSAIVFAAFRKYGDDIFKDLVGEFALVVWSKKSRELFLVRSFAGERLLYYAWNQGTLYWSSDFAHLVRVSGVPIVVNESYVFEYLLSHPNPRNSPIKAVKPVPPNTILRFRNGELVNETRLWNPAAVKDIRYGSDREYEEHCLETMREAVRARMAGVDCVFAELSGGLDSSSVVRLGDLVLKEENRDPESLVTVSCVFEDSHSCDESGFIGAVEEARGLRSFRVSEKQLAVTMGLANPEFDGVPTPFDCYPGRFQVIGRHMRERGAKVVMTGMGGDHLFWSEPLGEVLVADEIVKGDLAAAHRECVTWSRFAAVPYWRMLFQLALPLTLGKMAPSMAQFKRPSLPPWISADYRRRARSLVWEYVLSQDSCGLPSLRGQLRFIENAVAMTAFGYWSKYPDIEFSHPLLDRRLVECCLGVPMDQFLRNGQTRSLLRRTMAGILPEKVRLRKSKGLFDESFGRAVQREWEVFSDVSAFEVCREGLIDARELSLAAERFWVGRRVPDDDLLRVVSLESWLRGIKRLPLAGLEKTVKKPDAQENRLLLQPPTGAAVRN